MLITTQWVSFSYSRKHKPELLFNIYYYLILVLKKRHRFTFFHRHGWEGQCHYCQFQLLFPDLGLFYFHSCFPNSVKWPWVPWKVLYKSKLLLSLLFLLVYSVLKLKRGGTIFFFDDHASAQHFLKPQTEFISSFVSVQIEENTLWQLTVRYIETAWKVILNNVKGRNKCVLIAHYELSSWKH